MTRAPGEWAEFNCTVNCNYNIEWYIEGHRGDVTESCSSIVGGMMLCKQVTRTCSSFTDTGGYTETFRVLAKSEHAGSNLAVQCLAVSRIYRDPDDDCPPSLSFSRYSLFTGK